jgi:hypothetical protein
VRQRTDIAVQALDHLARRARTVKRHIQPQTVPGQVQAQGVGGDPGDILADVGRRNAQELLGHSDREEQQPDAKQIIHRARLHGRRSRANRVDETAHDLWVVELQADAAQKQPGQQGHPGPLRPQVADQQSPIRTV